MKTIRKSLLVGLVFSLLCLGVPFLTANAASIIIDDDLSGTLFFPGFPVENDDGSITYYGVAYTGMATGNLPGKWAMVLIVTADSTTETVEGGWAVGTRTDNVYGGVTGTIDPTAGSFNLTMLVLGGFGIYNGMTGAGSFQGALGNNGENIDGSLSLRLFPMTSKGHRGGLGKIDDGILSALILLEP